MELRGFLPDSLTPVTVHLDAGRIGAVIGDPQPAAPPGRRRTIVCPGLLDIQVNGFAGIGFNDPDLTVDGVAAVTRHLWHAGVAAYCPTVITDSRERMVRSLQTLARAAERPELGRSIAGYHVEGPYLCRRDGPRGAHPPAHVRHPDWDEWQMLQEAAAGRIRLITLAPELPGAIQFMERLVGRGVRVAIGHTAAGRQDIRAAIAAGACLSTHLGNAADDLIQRHHNYLFDQLAADELWASFIVDGHHLPPDVVRIFLRAKGLDRSVLISDVVRWGGLPPGVYDAGHHRVEVRGDGFVGVVGAPRLAGSGLVLPRAIANTVRFSDASLADAIRAATLHPARVLGLDDRLGRLEPGTEATLTVLEWDAVDRTLTPLQTIVGGQVVFDRAAVVEGPQHRAGDEPG